MLNKKILGKAKTALALMLTSAMIATLSPNFVGALKVHAETNKYGDTYFGINNLFGVDDSVTLGINPETNKPLKYRVLALDAKSGGYTYESDKDILLLDCKSVIKKMPLNDTPGYYNFNDTTLTNWLNSTFLSKSFTASERAAIPAVTNTQYTSNIYYHQEWIKDRQIFALSADEVPANCSKGGPWWTRSYLIADPTKEVYYSGGLKSTTVDDPDIYVSPALCLDKSKIVFSTEYEHNTSDWKLTIADSNIILGVDSNGVYRNGDGEIVVPFTLSGSDAGKVTSVAAFFQKIGATGGMTGYNRLKINGSISGSGTGTIGFPEYYVNNKWQLGKDYYMYVVAEINNDGAMPDYASNIVTVNHVHDYVFNTNGEKATISCAPCNEKHTASRIC